MKSKEATIMVRYEEGNALAITVGNEGQHKNVVDPDPGSGAFLTPGSGIRDE
jgi:hypothetical protein